ncbi:EAL domain-containing protein [Nitrincola tapanii]|uniref:EAL domain-containing protein n=1 Tax=Nitrincola tapanii TaxID=1708751 RepID=A0A5A9W572_9GAMM|nr:EAL domain-containing protein [Nitrincola tapanii]KAA0875916.1 EAL domain-containing protein [Nitrincola tapanii]
MSAEQGRSHGVTLVGIGASAGGLEALTRLVTALAPASHLSFVILQHLSPSHRSMMAEILSRETTLDVVDLEDGTLPRAGVIYVVPSSFNAGLRNECLHLYPAEPERVPKPSINEFFISLAAEKGEAAIGIVLSGTGSDGTAGLRAIQAAGGITIAQTPESAKYRGMPESAIEAGVADFVMSPEEMAARLPALVPERQEDLEPVAESTVKQLLNLLKERCQVDFSGYKAGTLARRIRRRVVATNHQETQAYLRWVESHPEELELLSRDILISVTSFFRDKEAFLALKEKIKEICEARREDEEIRVWVAGCASGEEAYSIAILFAEVLGERVMYQPVQIFATDIDEDALNTARRGLYPAAALAALVPERLQKFFRPVHKHYEVSKRLRDMIVFARHNLVDDPPFLRLDLITCRNVLIYFDNSLQTRVFQRFHFALRDPGFLFLGRSESVAQAEHLFLAENRRERLFRKQGASVVMPALTPRTKIPISIGRQRQDHLKILLSALTEHLNATLALCDSQGRILHTAGQVDRFFKFPLGTTETTIVEVILEPFRGELLALLQRCNKSRTLQQGRPRVFDEHQCQLLVMPVTHLAESANVVMISDLLINHRPLVTSEAVQVAPSEMAEELTATREHLQALIEELATANEEMQSLNEEAQASNEELQATNEELEAANEELQATNEELVSLNEEMNVKTTELSQLTAEYAHLYDSLEFPILVFDNDGCLRRFNAPAARRFNLRPTAVMQHIERLRLPEYLKPVRDLMQYVISHGDREEQLLSVEGRSLQLTVTPGLDDQDRIQSLVVTLVDITEISQAQSALKESQAQLNTLMENSTVLMAMKDMAGRYLFANRRFIEAFNLDPKAYLGLSDFELFPESFAGSLWTRDLEAMRTGVMAEAEHIWDSPNNHRVFRTVHQVLRNCAGHPSVIITESEDITRRKHAEDQLRIAARVFEHSGEAIAVTDAQGVIQSINEAFTQITGYEPEDAMGQSVGRLLKSGRHSQDFYEKMWLDLNQRGYWQGEIWNRRKNGEIYPEWLTINRVDDEAGCVEYFVAVFSDITNLKESQRKVEFLATHDTLTHLPNRNLFQDRLGYSIAQARRHNSQLALLFLDLDNFKAINDTLGHDAGDELLVEAANRLRQVVRDVDTVARLGGDEFTVILTDCNVEDAEFIAMRILHEMTRSFQVQERKVFVSASIGAAFYPDDAEDSVGLLKAADTAMYRAKDDGRNRLQLFKPEHRVQLLKQAAIESALHEALLHEELYLVYQPKFDAQHPEQIVGAEALLRWQDKTLGFVSPADFIPVAEKSGLILGVGRLVKRLLVRQLTQWRSQGLLCPPIAMNVSAQSFRESDFIERLQFLLESNGLNRGDVQLEITESSLMTSGSEEGLDLSKLKEQGIELSIDDFGTGYSSLSYLKRLPLAELKIDKSFVDGLGVDESDEAIARAILGMAKALGLRTVAEGVETQQQLAWLQEAGCNHIQGYLLSKPLSVEEFAQLLKTAQLAGKG